MPDFDPPQRRSCTKPQLRGPTPSNPRVLLVLRLSCLSIFLLLLASATTLQPLMDRLWEELRAAPIFRSVYFETVYTTLVYTLLLIPVSLLERFGIGSAYKIDPEATFQHPSWTTLGLDTLTYCTPLGLLDTFMVKAYHGVPQNIIQDKKEDWIQVERGLPLEAPMIGDMIVHLILSFFIYDALFFALHLLLHRHHWLYNTIHAQHHDHEEGLHGRVTNQLSVPERITLVLSANFSLKVLGAHPLTRVVYVPIFLWLLIENHWNYDLPFSYDKIIPFHLCGGSRHHLEHHRKGRGNYEPYFTYLDSIYTAYRNWRTSRLA